jgi:hypothetical protein
VSPDREGGPHTQASNSSTTSASKPITNFFSLESSQPGAVLRYAPPFGTARLRTATIVLQQQGADLEPVRSRARIRPRLQPRLVSYPCHDAITCTATSAQTRPAVVFPLLVRAHTRIKRENVPSPLANII